MLRPSKCVWKDDYWTMVKEWRAVVAQPLSEHEKEQMCFAILQDYIGQMALACARTSNPPLRFWTYMYVLEGNLRPGGGSNDQFARLALLPAYRWVSDWFKSSTVRLGSGRHG